MSLPEKFRALVATESGFGIEEFGFVDLDLGDVIVKVKYSALNFKDSLAANGNRGVATKLPLIPGIDAVGEVVESSDFRHSIGQQVLVGHADFGTAHHGAMAEFVRVPGDWVYALPQGSRGSSEITSKSLDLKTTVTWGTAGFTAAQSVEKIVEHGIKPDTGEVLVTGATGGVGIFAVKLLAKLGYKVVASTGKTERHGWLVENGASEILTRQDISDMSGKPLLKSRWAAAVDTVGGNTLATVLRSTQPYGCVTACGLVAGNELPITVYPFILRGITLCGISSALVDRDSRIGLWGKIAQQWNMDLSGIATEVTLDELPDAIAQITNGNIAGRTIVKM